MKRLSLLILLGILSIFILTTIPTVHSETIPSKIPVAKGPLNKINKHFSTQTITYSDGTSLDRNMINGPSKPPVGYDRDLAPASPPKLTLGATAGALSNVPAFKWVFGCSAVSGAMIAGYYDLHGYPNIYTGFTNGGDIPLVEDSSWGDWADDVGDSYPNNPLIASHEGLDGKTTRGSIDDYWVSYLSNSDDPYITNIWTQHAWWESVGDFMKTSQSAFGNVDGSTSFYTFTTTATPLTCGAMEGYGIQDEDGTYGRKLFYEARGYAVTDCYSQSTDNARRGGFSFAQYKAEIDAGRPVLLNLQGHSIVGVGYDDSSSTVYLHDTWNNDVHTMTWGTSYSGMKLLSVSIVNLKASVSDTPNIVVSPTSYNFGNVTVGSSSAKSFTITNTGSASLAISKITIGTDPAEFSVVTDGCSGSSISPASSCVFQAQFRPTSVNTKTATISIYSNDSDNSPLGIALTGTGVVLSDLSGTLSNVSRTGPARKGVYTISGTLTTTNAGQTNLNNVRVDFYLSNDAVASSDDMVKAYTYKVIGAGSSKTTTIQFTTTSPLTGKYLIAVIDPSNSIAESNELNNTVVSTVP